MRIQGGYCDISYTYFGLSFGTNDGTGACNMLEGGVLKVPRPARLRCYDVT